MLRTRRRLVPAVLLAVGLGTGGCTLVKPVVGAVVGPVVFAAASDGSVCGCGDGRGIVVALVVMSAGGAVVGLVTGIISDVQALTGEASDPTNYWWDPFKTNTSVE